MLEAAPRASSATATRVAALRALHMLHDGEPKILDDPLSLRLLDPAERRRVVVGGPSLHTPRLRSLRAHTVLRSRYAEDRLAEAAARGVRDLVILGAGLETFAFRRPGWAAELGIFEVDHPASQDEKRARLAAASLPLPPELHLVPFDLEAGALPDALHRAGFDRSAPAFFWWLGVTMYLSRETIEAVFGFVASLPRSTEIVFTFVQPALPGSPDWAESRAAELGEPFQTLLTQAEVTALLGALGFSVVDVPTTDELEARYLRGRTDQLRVSRRARLARAVV